MLDYEKTINELESKIPKNIRSDGPSLCAKNLAKSLIVLVLLVVPVSASFHPALPCVTFVLLIVAHAIEFKIMEMSRCTYKICAAIAKWISCKVSQLLVYIYLVFGCCGLVERCREKVKNCCRKAVIRNE